MRLEGHPCRVAGGHHEHSRALIQRMKVFLLSQELHGGMFDLTSQGFRSVACHQEFRPCGAVNSVPMGFTKVADGIGVGVVCPMNRAHEKERVSLRER